MTSKLFFDMNIAKSMLWALVCCMVAPLWSCADTLTLNMTAILNDYPQTESGYWEGTYGNQPVETPHFVFSHHGDADNGGMAYWEGFTVCTSGSTANYGEEGSSDGWIANQWGCMAGGGVDEQGQPVSGQAYMVAYWGFHAETIDSDYHSLRVDFTDEKSHKPIGVWICNHPWPYYGIVNGDGFATAFTQEGDYFALVAHGLNEQGEPTGSTIRMELATFHDGALQQSSEWQYLDLSALGTVSALYFTMETSDADALYGANTAVYFCLDRLQVLDAAASKDSLARPSGLTVTQADETSLTLCWNKTTNAERYTLRLNGDSVGQTADTVFVFTDLRPLTEYTLSVTAVRGEAVSEPASLKASTLDLTAPATPTDLTVIATEYSLQLTWQAATDNVAVTRYTVYVNDEPVRRTTQTTFTIDGLEPDTEYSLAVEAEDASGNRSDKTATIARTLCLTALHSTLTDSTDCGYYDLKGNYIGSDMPAQKGIYILRTNQTTKKISIN